MHLQLLLHEVLVFLNDRLFVDKVELSHDVIEHLLGVLDQGRVQPINFFIVAFVDREDFAESVGKLADRALLISVFRRFWLDNAVLDPLADLYQEVGQSLDTSRVLIDEPLRELLLGLPLALYFLVLA